MIGTILGRYGTVFAPLTCDCRELARNRYECDYERLNQQVSQLMSALDIVKHELRLQVGEIEIHTEYQVPMWWSEDFVNNYIKAIARVIEEVERRSEAIREVAIEVHPGFGSAEKSRETKPIIDGVTRLMMGVATVASNYGLRLSLNVEARSSSSTIDRRPQAIATLEELTNFITRLRQELGNHGLDVEVVPVIDVPQLIRAYMKIKRMPKEEAQRHVIEKARALVTRQRSELHVHWFREPEMRIPHAPITINVWNTVYKPIIQEAVDKSYLTIVPEISPMTGIHDVINTLRIIANQVNGASR